MGMMAEMAKGGLRGETYRLAVLFLFFPLG